MSVEAQHTDRQLKCLPDYFEDVVNGRKTFEVRRRDPGRVFLTGELLLLREWDWDRYTGREVEVRITYVCPLDAVGCEGFDGMAIKRVRLLRFSRPVTEVMVQEHG